MPMSCIQGHQSSDIPSITPPSLKKQNNVLTSWWRGAEGRAGREGGKLGNQMWSIKTYWHAKGLPLPHSHTESTNSYNRPRCIHVCVHMSHTGRTKPHTHTHNRAWAHREVHNMRVTMCEQSINASKTNIKKSRWFRKKTYRKWVENMLDLDKPMLTSEYLRQKSTDGSSWISVWICIQLVHVPRRRKGMEVFCFPPWGELCLEAGAGRRWWGSGGG